MTRVYMPGDMIANTSLAFQELTETLVTLSEVSVAGILFRSIGDIFAEQPRLACLVYLIAQEERVRQMDWISSLLHLPAAGRVATLLLNLFDRRIAMASPSEVSIPFFLTQYDIADLTGLSATHTNRVIQKFRVDKLVSLNHHTLTVINRSELELVADRPNRSPATDLSWLPGTRAPQSC